MKDKLLKQVQDTEFDLLLLIDDICDKLNLNYSISAGTLLGAVRHKGFIPWDDDVDLMMPRKDYEIFIKEAPKLIDKNKYYIENYKLDKNTKHAYIKVKNNNTTFINEARAGEPIHQGIWADISPIDKISNDVKKQNKMIRNESILRHIRDCSRKPYRATINSTPKKIIAFSIAWIGKLIGYNRMVKITDKMLQKYNGDEKATMTLSDYLLPNRAIPMSWYDEYTELEFNGHKLKAISHYKEYLEMLYGDYMTMPPVEQRVTHKATLVDPDNSYTKYVGPKGQCKVSELEKIYDEIIKNKEAE